MKKQEVVRKMQYAGSWYESDPDLLKDHIVKALNEAENRAVTSSEKKTGACLAMLPHAGLLYSSKGIADFFTVLPIKTSNILIIAPSHYAHIPPDTFTTADFTVAETPLADLRVMPLNEILPGRVMHLDKKSLELEHAIEMFLPFCANLQLQSKKDITIGMCLVSDVSSEKSTDMLSEAILEATDDGKILNGQTLIIASSDFTHYGRRFGYTPFSDASHGLHKSEISEIEEQVLRHDRKYAEKFASGDIGELLSLKEKEQPSICGFASGLIVSNIAKKLGMTGQIRNQYTSNSISGPSSDFVSYCSILWR